METEYSRNIRRAAADNLLMTAIKRLDHDDPNYPALLRRLPDPPAALELMGQLHDLPMVAIVGSRAAGAATVRLTRTLARELSERGLCVVSGGALGVDAAAHRGALDAGGVTVAVLGSGLLAPYPERNIPLFEEIGASGQGAVVSEHASRTPPRGWHFPRRNRLIAALSGGVAVTRASARSGALHTARWASRLGLPVMAVAGSPGCNKLIAAGGARVGDAADVMAALHGQPPPAASRDRVTADQAKLLELMPAGAVSLDDLALTAQWTAARTAMVLVQLELLGRVEAAGAGRYRRLKS